MFVFVKLEKIPFIKQYMSMTLPEEEKNDRDMFLESLNPLSSNINMRILFTVLSYLLWYCLGEFVQTTKQLIFGDHFNHSHDLYFWSGSYIFRRN